MITIPRISYILLIAVLAVVHCSQTGPTLFDGGGVVHRGLTMVAPPGPFEVNPMSAIQDVAANSIAVVPYGFTRIGQPSVFYNQSDRQWWGERPVGVIKSIELAHRANLTVLLKPQIYVPGSWTGHLTFTDKEDWEKWENDYRNYILLFASLADSLQVQALCIGTEFKLSVKERASFWVDLITEVRTLYDGQLTYAANWDDFQDVPFWDLLDFIGINAYFPINDSKTPVVNTLVKDWERHLPKIEAISSATQKAVVFTEYGYLSVDHCAHETWELEKNISNRPINEQAQANALEALYQVFSEKPYWTGGYLWKWFPNGAGHEGYTERDYTPQGKLSEGVIKKWYGSF